MIASALAYAQFHHPRPLTADQVARFVAAVRESNLNAMRGIGRAT